MKTQFLLPHKCKWIGLGVLALGILTFFFDSTLEKLLTFDVENIVYFAQFNSGKYQDFSYTLQIFLIVAGGVLVVFSKEKIEDEFTMSIRLKALMYSVLVNYIIVLVTDVFLYGEDFLFIMVYNFYTIIILYVLIFHCLLWINSRKEASNEK
jgi:hypothetical protein